MSCILSFVGALDQCPLNEERKPKTIQKPFHELSRKEKEKRIPNEKRDQKRTTIASIAALSCWKESGIFFEERLVGLTPVGMTGGWFGLRPTVAIDCDGAGTAAGSVAVAGNYKDLGVRIIYFAIIQHRDMT